MLNARFTDVLPVVVGCVLLPRQAEVGDLDDHVVANQNVPGGEISAIRNGASYFRIAVC